MAKRKRLTPARPGYFEGADSFGGPAPETKTAFPVGIAPPPISRVAGDAAAAAALREVTEELTAARQDGRLLLRLALDEVEEGWLMRDRLGGDDAEFDGLLSSLRAHGQRTPIEVARTSDGRFGLISGWRRMTALRRLHTETGDQRHAFVLAIERRPETAEDAYVAMVEENEIRLGLSYFERARIAAKAVEAGVFVSEKIALQRLFAAASRAKRSKIGSFLGIYHSLQGHLRFAPALPERLGLLLARGLEADPDLASRLAVALAAAAPDSAEAEQAVLLAAVQQRPRPAPQKAQGASPVVPQSREI
ncbi:MAG: ParB N-terminal domain-containing protein, partial [Paracoccaceae bacterium]|nr:ParB N-terminal domain-containing protein [Paracoccaceae bacterium]